MKLTDVALISKGNYEGKKGGEGVHTESIRGNVVASQTVHLSEFTAMDGTNVEEVLPTFPY